MKSKKMKSKNMKSKNMKFKRTRVLNVRNIDLKKINYKEIYRSGLLKNVDLRKASYEVLEQIDMDSEAWDLSRLVKVVKRHLPPVPIRQSSKWVVIIHHNIKSASEIQSEADFLCVKAHPKVCGATLKHYYERSHPIENLAILHNERILNGMVQTQSLASKDNIIVLRAVELAKRTQGNCSANPIEIPSDSEDKSSSQSSRSSKPNTASPAPSGSLQASNVVDLEHEPYAYPCELRQLLDPNPETERFCGEELEKWINRAHKPNGGKEKTFPSYGKHQITLDGWIQNNSNSEPGGSPCAHRESETRSSSKKRCLSENEDKCNQEQAYRAKRRKRGSSCQPYFKEEAELAFEAVRQAKEYGVNDSEGLRLDDVPQVLYRDTLLCASELEVRKMFLPEELADMQWSGLEHRIEALPVVTSTKEELRQNQNQVCAHCGKAIHILPWTRFHPQNFGPVCTQWSRWLVHAWANVPPPSGEAPIDCNESNPSVATFNKQIFRYFYEKHLKQMKLGQRLIMDFDNRGDLDSNVPRGGLSFDFSHNYWDQPGNPFYDSAYTPVSDPLGVNNHKSEIGQEASETDDEESFFSCEESQFNEERADDEVHPEDERSCKEFANTSSELNYSPPPTVQSRHAYSESSTSDDEAEMDVELVDETDGAFADDEDSDWAEDDD